MITHPISQTKHPLSKLVWINPFYGYFCVITLISSGFVSSSSRSVLATWNFALLWTDNWNNCCSLLETTKKLVEIELGGVQVCVAYDLSYLLVVFILLWSLSLLAVVVAQLVALIVAGTVHRVCITTWYVTLNTHHWFFYQPLAFILPHGC